jgi:hypothetical protein
MKDRVRKRRSEMATATEPPTKKEDDTTPGITTLAIPVREIDDLQSFRDIVTNPRNVAGVYWFAIMDFLVQLASKTSKDFFDRPHLYVNLDDDYISETIAKLRFRSGFDERLPSQEQRGEMYLPIVGIKDGLALDGAGDFQRLADQLIQAATAFAERVYDTGEDMLRERVRIAHRSFKQYLEGLEGNSLVWTSEKVLPQLTEDVAYAILRNKGIASVFGVSTPIDSNWPYVEDADADKMVEEMSKQLPWADGAPLHLSRERISNLQSIASTGAEAIAAVFDYDGNAAKVKDLLHVIKTVYAWGSELTGQMG